MNPNIEFAIKTAQAYNAVCKPLCQELKLPQTAFDILMFLANNPDRRTASDIVEFRHIKANLVSMNVDRLVKEGYLERRAVAGDRRKTELLCTEKARPVIERGRAVQNAFFARLLTNTDEPTREAFFRTMETPSVTVTPTVCVDATGISPTISAILRNVVPSGTSTPLAVRLAFRVSFVALR